MNNSSVSRHFIFGNKDNVILCTHVLFTLFVGGLMSYLHYLCLLVYSGVQHVLCCVFLLPLSSSCVLCMMASNTYCIVFLGLFVFVLCLVYDGIQHVLYCVSWFICFRLMSCVPNIASFSGLPILDCPFGSSNNILPIKKLWKVVFCNSRVVGLICYDFDRAFRNVISFKCSM